MAKDKYIEFLDSKYDQVTIYDLDYKYTDWDRKNKGVFYEETVTFKESIEILTNSGFIYYGEPLSREELYMEYKKNKYNNTTTELTNDVSQRFYQPNKYNIIIKIVVIIILSVLFD